ncbi:MAG: TIGR01620 family protein [Geminicoccales bacterium]
MSPNEPIAPFEIDPHTLRPERIELAEPETPVPAPVVPEPPKPPARPWLRLFIGAGALLILGLLGLEAYQLLASLFATTPLLGSLFALLIGLVAIGALGMAGREIMALARLAKAERLRAEGERLLGSDLHGRADDLIEAIRRAHRGRADVQDAIAKFEKTASEDLNDSERLCLFARTVLAPIDRQGYRAVRNAARDVGALTALSPLGLLDSLVVLARTLAMLRAIARLYGMRPGYLATISLLRRAFRNVLVAGVGELLSDAAVETLGASLLSMLSARAGQGVVNGLLAAKLGLSAMQLCRPLPFAEDEMPSLRQLRSELLAQIGAREPAAPGER